MVEHVTRLISKAAAPRVPLDKIFPNRLNPNEMGATEFFQLKDDMRVDDYDPIIISPMKVFYSDKALEDPRVWEKIPPGPNGITSGEVYIICDGYHRWRAAIEIGLKDIRAMTYKISEKDAMPFFFRRQKIRGKLDPIKEAMMFRAMISEHEIGLDEVVRRFNLSSRAYLKTRLELLNIAMNVVPLYYDPPEDMPGELSISHLRELTRIPKRDQRRVALMSLERNWGIVELRDEIRRIKEGRGTRSPHATIEAPKEIPPPRVKVEKTLLERLMPWEIEAIEYVQTRYEEGNKTGVAELRDIFHRGNSTVRAFLGEMVKEGIFNVEEVSSRGRYGYRKVYWPKENIVLPEVEPVPEIEPSEPLSEEEIFEEYAEAPADEDIKTIQDTVVPIPLVVQEPEKFEAPRVCPHGLHEPLGNMDVCQSCMKLKRKWGTRPAMCTWVGWPDEAEPEEPEEPKVEVEPEPMVEKPALVINRDLIESLLQEVIMKGAIEGFDLNATDKIGGKWPDEKLMEEFQEAVDLFVNKGLQSALVYVMLKAAQLHIRAEMMAE